MSAPPPQQPPPPYPPPTDYMPSPIAPPPAQNAPPQSQYYPQPAQYQQDHTTVVVTQPGYGASPSSSRSPVSYKCHVCGTQQITRVSYDYGGAFWLIFLVLCLLVGIFAFIMFCIDDLKDVHHTCPNCNSTVGVNKGSC